MKALVYHGRGDIRCDTVPEPQIEDGRDAILKVSACAICGSDLHLIGGFVPEMKDGDVLGHECMGEVVEVGKDNKRCGSGPEPPCRTWPPRPCDNGKAPSRWPARQKATFRHKKMPARKTPGRSRRT